MSTFTKESGRKWLEDRPDYITKSILRHRQSAKFVHEQVKKSSTLEIVKVEEDVDIEIGDSSGEFLTPVEKKNLKGKVKHMLNEARMFNKHPPYLNPMEIRLHDVSYVVPAGSNVFNKCLGKTEKNEAKVILNKINLVLKPGKTYLILGAPGSGKTSLLRAIAGLLPEKRMQGSITYNGLSSKNDAGVCIRNAISFIEQLDHHAPRLTVRETFDFAFQCKSGGSHSSYLKTNSETKELIKKLDEEDFRINSVMQFLGVDHVANTFVGNSDVRGISGGQRRRVSLGEMMQNVTSIMCADEISNGLDSASTYDIIESLSFYTKIYKLTRIISLLQPSPETYCLFDEVILLCEGNIAFAGAIDEALDYFKNLGYEMPPTMDVAEFLQCIPTSDGKEFFNPTLNNTNKLMSPKEFGKVFLNSPKGQALENDLLSPSSNDWRNGKNVQKTTSLKYRFHNTLTMSTWLNLRRHLTIWKRDKQYVIALAIKNVVMGLSVGMVFFQTDESVSIFGVLFQGMLFIMLGAMTSVPEQVNDRGIFYKHQHQNFFQTASFVVGRSISLIPQATCDCLIFGTLIYWLVGLAPTASAYFIFIAVILVFTLTMSQMFGILAAFARSKAAVQAVSAFMLLLIVLFCGFLVAPNVIPGYYQFLYWWNPLSWSYRALLVNEFTSSKYNNPSGVIYGNTELTTGQVILGSKGFVLRGTKIYGREWIAYSFAYLITFIIICVAVTGLIMAYWRVDVDAIKRGTPNLTIEKEQDVPDDESDDVKDLFVPVDLTFENICYEVKSSQGNHKLKLLEDVNGMFLSGRMCAIIGSSGAGKTTLMDVIAMRKHSGTITGEICLNGFPQERKTFRRCSGYVEQFDVQSPELTIKETILFSANMRLDSNNPMVDDILKYVNKIIQMLELTSEQNLRIANLTFEQRKRLSIAVELAASPSIIFLDEPTTGLDSRAAMMVMNILRRICDTGRTICATIHQPSSQIFYMFDDLLLLKTGGKAIFCGELGQNSSKLINYFESIGASPITRSENPSTWILSQISDGSTDQIDFAKAYRNSQELSNTKEQIQIIKAKQDLNKKIQYDNDFAAPKYKRSNLMNARLNLIYWRSPVYNLGRVTLSVFIAFILASVFITNRHPKEYHETDMSSILSTIFISFIIFGVLSITSVLPVMKSIRDIYYRHKAAGMLGYQSLAQALVVAETPFILMSSTLFCIVFYFGMGFQNDARKFFAFWGFFALYIAISSYFGQAFMCLVNGMATAQILASVFIGMNNFFSGLIVRPQYLTGFWQTTYWITPGHYVYEGLVMSQFWDDETPVRAYNGSDFFVSLGCTLEQSTACVGTVSQYIDEFFGGRFNEDHMMYDALVLFFFFCFAR